MCPAKAEPKVAFKQTLKQVVYFDYDKDLLRDDARIVLDAKAAILVANPAITVVGADPEGSLYSGDTPRPYLVEGSARTSGRRPSTPRSWIGGCGSPTPIRSVWPGR